jgi:hypothetical protein
MYFQEVGSPAGRIVKSDEFLKTAGMTTVSDLFISLVLQFACYVMFPKSSLCLSHFTWQETKTSAVPAEQSPQVSSCSTGTVVLIAFPYA